MRHVGRHYNFPDWTIHLIGSHLSDRKCSIDVDQTIPTQRTILPGVPQGCLIGPVLFQRLHQWHSKHLNPCPTRSTKQEGRWLIVSTNLTLLRRADVRPLSFEDVPPLQRNLKINIHFKAKFWLLFKFMGWERVVKHSVSFKTNTTHYIYFVHLTMLMCVRQMLNV